MNQKQYNKKVKKGPTSSPLLSRVQNSSSPPYLTSNTITRYLCDLSLAPGVLKLLESGILTTKFSDDGVPEPTVRSASDFSYSADQYAGKYHRIVGDAGGEFGVLLLRKSSKVYLSLKLSSTPSFLLACISHLHQLFPRLQQSVLRFAATAPRRKPPSGIQNE